MKALFCVASLICVLGAAQEDRGGAAVDDEGPIILERIPPITESGLILSAGEFDPWIIEGNPGEEDPAILKVASGEEDPMIAKLAATTGEDDPWIQKIA